jgi:hypothetical protein
MSNKNYLNDKMQITCRELIESGLMDRPFFESRRSLVAEMRLIDCMNSCDDSSLLYEGFDGAKKKALQAIISGAAQYGLGALTLPAGGAGLVVGPTAETVIDGLFAADSVASTVKSVKDIAAVAGEFSNLLQDALTASKMISELKFKEFYQTVVRIIKKGLKLLGKKASEKVDDVAEKLKSVVKNLLDKLTDALSAGIKLVIPDTAIGTAVATSASMFLQKATESAYDSLTGTIKKIGKLSEFITDPDKAPNFFQEMMEKMNEFFLAAADKLEDKSLLKSILGGGLGVATKFFGPSGLRKLVAAIEKRGPDLVELIGKVTQVIIPATFAVLAVYQCLMKGDYKGQEKEKNKNQSQESNKNSSNEQRNESKNYAFDGNVITRSNFKLKDHFYFD